MIFIPSVLTPIPTPVQVLTPIPNMIDLDDIREEVSRIIEDEAVHIDPDDMDQVCLSMQDYIQSGFTWDYAWNKALADAWHLSQFYVPIKEVLVTECHS